MRGTAQKCETKWGMLEPSVAARYLKDNRFPNQRDMKPWHVRALVKLHNDDRLDGRAIVIVLARIKGYKKDYLINGQHTCSAIMWTEKPLLCNFMVAHCRDMADAVNLYSVYDTQRVRTQMDAIRAAGLASDLDGRETNSFGAAVKVINGNFKGSTAQGPLTEVPDRLKVVEMSKEWTGEAGVYFKIVHDAEGKLGRWLRAGPIAAVGLVTLRSCPDSAMKFWDELVSGEVKAGSPTRQLRDYMLSNNSARLNGQQRAWLVSRTWNRWITKTPMDKPRWEVPAHFYIEKTLIGAAERTKKDEMA